jgi:hypothetical protein
MRTGGREQEPGRFTAAMQKAGEKIGRIAAQGGQSALGQSNYTFWIAMKRIRGFLRIYG